MSKPRSVILTDLPPAPDFLGVAVRVATIADLIQNSQEQIIRFSTLMLANGHDDDSPIPTGDEGETVTYGERLGVLKDGVAKMLEANQDIAEELTAEAVKRRKIFERRLEKREEDGE